MTTKEGLSKSRYCKGIQCPKMLWMDKNMPDKAADMDETVLEVGSMVGDVARSYFGDYELVHYSSDKQAMADKTKELIALQSKMCSLDSELDMNTKTNIVAYLCKVGFLPWDL